MFDHDQFDYFASVDLKNEKRLREQLCYILKDPTPQEYSMAKLQSRIATLFLSTVKRK